MKISYNWLKDYLECDLTTEAVAQALTSIGLEVDALEEIEFLLDEMKSGISHFLQFHTRALHRIWDETLMGIFHYLQFQTKAIPVLQDYFLLNIVLS